MLFNRKNIDIIKQNAFNMHDADFDGFIFDRSSRNLKIEVMLPFKDEKTKIIFNGVIGFSATCCDFWGESERISCFCQARDDDRQLIEDIFRIKRSTENDLSILKTEEDYLEMIIELISGDSIRIACECVEIESF